MHFLNKYQKADISKGKKSLTLFTSIQNTRFFVVRSEERKSLRDY